MTVSIIARGICVLVTFAVALGVLGIEATDVNTAGRNPRIVFVDGLGATFGVMYSIQLDGKGLRRLATNASDPAVSPNGKLIAYWGEPDGLNGGLYVMRRDGTHRRLLDKAGDGVESGPAWSPNGKRLVFVRSELCSACAPSVFAARLFTIGADGSKRRFLRGSPVEDPGPTWINSREILVTAGLSRFAIVNSRTGRIRRMIVAPASRSATGPGPYALAISPDKRVLAYTECIKRDCSATLVNLVTLGGRLIRRIPAARTPTWSSRGDLFYSCCQDYELRGNHNRILVATPRGGHSRAITPSWLHAGQPAWLG